MTFDLAYARSTAVEAAETAGGLVRDGLFHHFAVHAKGTNGDVVTDLDLTSEKLIVDMLKARFPGHRIISEETGGVDSASSWTWVIDPVDGTNNIAVGLAVLTIGITLCRNNIPVVSAVHDPVSQRTWSAILHRGAWGASGRLTGVPRKDIKRRRLFAWMQGYSVTADDKDARALRMVLARRAHRVFDLWAPLTCWMMLARGDLDGIVGYRIGEIDLHAGALVAGEVGLTIREFSGKPFVARLRGANDDVRILAGSEDVVAELTGMVSAAKRIAGRVDDAVANEFVNPDESRAAGVFQS